MFAQVISSAAISGYRIEVEQEGGGGGGGGGGSVRTIHVNPQACEHEVNDLHAERAYTGTNVQILTQKLAQKYTYWRRS
jgi:hypothetical protein